MAETQLVRKEGQEAENRAKARSHMASEAMKRSLGFTYPLPAFNKFRN